MDCGGKQSATPLCLRMPPISNAVIDLEGKAASRFACRLSP